MDFPKGVHIPAATQPPKSATLDLSNERLSVLVVNDEKEIRDILSDALLYHNCHVTTAEDAKTAIDFIKQSYFDLIITDVKMPGMDGISFLTEIALKNLADGTIKIILTGGIIEDIKAATRKSPHGTVDGILNKPFTSEELLQIIHRATHKKRAA